MYFDGIQMQVIVNCPQVATTDLLRIEMSFSSSWNDNYLSLNLIKGMIYRSFLSKNALDEQNVNYGNDRVNLTQCAVMGLRLSDTISLQNYDLFNSLINSMNNRFNAAINQVKSLSNVDYKRWLYSINIIDTLQSF